MKSSVWVIERGSYSDYKVVGVFTSKENADDMAAMINKAETHGEPATVAEWPLDPAIKELRAGFLPYHVWMLRDGTTERCKRCDVSIYNIENETPEIWRRSRAPAYKGQGIEDCISITVWAKDDKHAVKIVNEMRAQMIASNRWRVLKND